ncbi:hypothetical protein [Leyella stercorea]|uniref:hypothetical protein n=1 Tax=Leyella stercorea TaxID=363265 RepID=UPI003A8D3402
MLGKIKVGTAFNKSYTHNMDFDNNTTMDFGTVQPLLCQYLLPRSEVKLNYRQLVRLAPMPTPSFARMYVKNYVRFVNIADVVPYHEALLSANPFYSGTNSFIPRYMPFTTNRILQYFLLQHSMYTVYGYEGGSYVRLVQNSDVTKEQYNKILSSFYVYMGFGSTGNPSSYMRLLERGDSMWHYIEGPVSFFDADYIVPIFDFTDLKNTTPIGFICFRYSNKCRRLRKQFVGLGYGLQLEDNTHISFAPLLAYYKSYFDTFGLTRVKAFESTACYALIRLISEYNYDFGFGMFVNVDPNKDKVNRHLKFIEFLNDLADVYYTSPNTFVAAHREKPNNDARIPLNGQKFLVSNGSVLNDIQDTSSFVYQPTVSFSEGADGNLLSQLSLDLLKRVTRFVAKDSAIGYRISDWVRVHYGSDVANTLFEQSNFVSESTTPIDISDVFSTSDTANVGTEDKGENLGAYAGKGIGFSKNGCSFRALHHGYFFMFSVLVPQMRDFVGTDPTLYAIDKDTIPVADFDALGMEVTPRAALVGDNFIASRSGEFTNKSFGFIPRYSGFKVKKDVVNGDMYLGHFKRDLQSYFLDRIPYNNFIRNVVEEKSGSGIYHVVDMSFANSPNSSVNWQVLDGKTNIGNFNRLFYDEGDIVSDYNNPENFIVQTVFDFKVRNFLKPISESYETFDDTNDNNTTNVSAN